MVGALCGFVCCVRPQRRRLPARRPTRHTQWLTRVCAHSGAQEHDARGAAGVRLRAGECEVVTDGVVVGRAVVDGAACGAFGGGADAPTVEGGVVVLGVMAVGN